MSFVVRVATKIFKPGPLGQLLFDALTPSAPTQLLGDISQQTAKEGDPRLVVYGRVRPIGGNIIHCQAPVVRTVKVKTSGGKGGSKKKSQKVERVFRSYAIGVCEGPITAFVRIWRNGKLVYDTRGNDWGATNNPVFLNTHRLYLGEWGQLPDATLEGIWGVGQVPAYRGTAYLVAIDEDLTELGGAVPQWQFEVARAEFVASTSTPYGLLSRDSAAAIPPAPLSVGVRTQVHRRDSDEALGSALPEPTSVTVASEVFRQSTSEILLGGLPLPADVAVIQVARRTVDSEQLVADLPVASSVVVTRAVVRLDSSEVLTATLPTPSNVSVTPA
ncbi:hypothetical protein D3C80_996420 [compost metagenome]